MTSATIHHPEGYSGRRAATLCGITYRQLDYWARTDLIRPSLTDANGSGTRRAYSDRDLVELRVIRELLDGGFRLEELRPIVPEIQATSARVLAEGTVIVSPAGVTIANTAEEVIDALNQRGAIVVLQVAPLVDELTNLIAQETATVAA